MLGLLRLTKSELELLDSIIKIFELEKIDKIDRQTLEVLDNIDSEKMMNLIQLIYENLDQIYDWELVRPTKIERKLFEYKNQMYMIQKIYIKTSIKYNIRKTRINEPIKRLNTVR